MKDYISRITQIIDYNNMSLRQFCKKIDCPYSTLNTFMNGKRDSLDINIVNSIINTFEVINPDWLITGKGEMLRDVPGVIQEDGVAYQPYAPPPDELREMIEYQRELIKQQKDLILMLQEQLKMQQKDNDLNDRPDAREDDAAGCADASGF